MVALTANACAGEDSAAAGGSSSEIHIGAWLPLTGATATYGVAERAGADAYFKMLNASGGVNGRKIKWTVKAGRHKTGSHNPPGPFPLRGRSLTPGDTVGLDT
ncbi:ABC transporter substrate-binding protein, partial [Streptomyces sp. NPDC002143]